MLGPVPAREARPRSRLLLEHRERLHAAHPHTRATGFQIPCHRHLQPAPPGLGGLADVLGPQLHPTSTVFIDADLTEALLDGVDIRAAFWEETDLK
ncbi:hypothetical protein ACF05L_12155 [Streptomyces bobili]|uniref:hypothetical protein n=1 Tax=Streptomyces bobili TaxID=67280 RepID=UPI0036FA5626